MSQTRSEHRYQNQNYSYGDGRADLVEGPILCNDSKSESLMPQIEAAQKMAAILCEEIARLSDRLSPVCSQSQTEPCISGSMLRQGSGEPAPAVRSIYALKETLSNCESQIRSIQMRLAV